jgi:hypothetical protein
MPGAFFAQADTLGVGVQLVGGDRVLGSESSLRRLTALPPHVTIGNMAGMSFTEALRQSIRESGLPYLTLEQETGVHRASISRFMAGERSLRLDVADKLAAYFGLEVRAAKKAKG